jgi:hypothetical protein
MYKFKVFARENKENGSGEVGREVACKIKDK